MTVSQPAEVFGSVTRSKNLVFLHEAVRRDAESGLHVADDAE